MNNKFFIRLLFVSLLLIAACNSNKDNNQDNPKELTMEEKLQDFNQDYLATVKPLQAKAWETYFDASISGSTEDFGKFSSLMKDYNAFVADKERFKKIKEIHDAKLSDPVSARLAKKLYYEFLNKQTDVQKLNVITDLETQIEEKYGNFRAMVNDKALSDNEVEEVLRTSANSEELQKTWLAHKAIGPVVADDILKLVKLRNEVARELGFNNFHEMSLILSDQDPKEIKALFDELDALTRDDFASLKQEIDAAIAKKCNIKPEDLRPWHYQNRFFQEAPSIYSIDLDKYYHGLDLVDITKKYYAGIGLPIDKIVERSDLFPKEGKNQHAYCVNIDRDAKDIRVLCNVVPNSMWMNTMLHEYGHAVYENYYDESLPWALKEPAHIFTTEAIAMMFGRLASNAHWMQENIGISKAEAEKIATTSSKILRLEQLVFSRWSQVMYRFEKGLYENPDQDLGKLWWDLVEQYQMLTRPEGRNEPDWASKIHIATSPCYYHNYHMGELLASQLYFTIAQNILKIDDVAAANYSNNKEIGHFLVDKVFSVGQKYQWNDMIKMATGEKLTPIYYAKQFVTQKNQ